jgi:hypothetical protein
MLGAAAFATQRTIEPTWFENHSKSNLFRCIYIHKREECKRLEMNAESLSNAKILQKMFGSLLA